VSFLLAIVNPISTFLALLRCSRRTESQRRMSFFLGIVLGIAFGLGLVIAFARSETSRSKRRRDLLKWLNHELIKIWPYVSEVLCFFSTASECH
ncbi:hypothetical protein GW17_00050184, partial [Ensete ventricosum]